MQVLFFTNQTPPQSPLITVTRWGVPPHGPHLILLGTPEETRAEAAQYFSADDKIRGFTTSMRQDEFDALPEFEG